jgi:hypothetical protein
MHHQRSPNSAIMPVNAPIHMESHLVSETNLAQKSFIIINLVQHEIGIFRTFGPVIRFDFMLQLNLVVFIYSSRELFCEVDQVGKSNTPLFKLECLILHVKHFLCNFLSLCHFQHHLFRKVCFKKKCASMAYCFRLPEKYPWLYLCKKDVLG